MQPQNPTKFPAFDFPKFPGPKKHRCVGKGGINPHYLWRFPWHQFGGSLLLFLLRPPRLVWPQSHQIVFAVWSTGGRAGRGGGVAPPLPPLPASGLRICVIILWARSTSPQFLIGGGFCITVWNIPYNCWAIRTRYLSSTPFCIFKNMERAASTFCLRTSFVNASITWSGCGTTIGFASGFNADPRSTPSAFCHRKTVDG